MTEDEPQISDDDMRARLRDLAESGDPWTDPLPRVLAVAAPRPEPHHRDRRSWRVGLAVAAAVAVVVGGIGWTLRDVGGSGTSTSAGLAEGDAAGAPAPAPAADAGPVCGATLALPAVDAAFTTRLSATGATTVQLVAASSGDPVTLTDVGNQVIVVADGVVVGVLDTPGTASLTITASTAVGSVAVPATDCRTGAALPRSDYDVYAVITSNDEVTGPWAGPVRITLG